MSQLPLDQVLRILELTNLTKTTENDFPAIKRKAMRRWHPDSVMHTKDEERIKEYTRNFQSIDAALTDLAYYLKHGPEEKGAAVAEEVQKADFRASKTPDTVEVLRKEAPRMQKKLRDLWETIKEKGYKQQDEMQIIFEGWKIKDLLVQDIKDGIPALAISSLFNGFFLCVVLALLGSAAGGNGLAGIVFLAWLIQAAACLITILPLSRFWLPNGLDEFILNLVNAGALLHHGAEKIGLTKIGFFQLLFGIPALLGRLTQWIILYPLYVLVGEFAGEKSIGKIYRLNVYYAGLASWHIEELINKAPAQMTEEELYHLAHAYAELKDVK